MLHSADKMSSTVSPDLLSTTWPDVSDPLLPNASHLCHDCRSMGREIRQLCEGKDFTLTKPWALFKKSSSTCAFCRLITSECSPETCKSEGDFLILNKNTKYEYYPAHNSIDRLIVRHEGKSWWHGNMKLAVFTTEG